MDRQKLNIIADGSIISLANTQRYNQTLKSQLTWTWKQLNQFLLDTNKDNLIVFHTSHENEYNFEFLFNEETSETYFRKFEQSVEVTDGCLYLINWTDLTSSLQFTDLKLPLNSNKDLKIDLENGFYKVIIKQLFDPEDLAYSPNHKTNFAIEFFIQSKNPKLYADKINWAEDIPNDDTIFLSADKNEFDDLLDKMISEGR